MHSQRRPNRLAQQKSPYLLQHRFNPVDWFPWSEDAFGLAQRQRKPVFLSIGYSTCHWCHVMERESFEDPSVADFLTQHFISIKLDREERPDLDKIYMTFVQAISGQGGWPLSVFLTPDRKPFYGGTYFPPAPKFGRPSFLQLLQQVAHLWNSRQTDLCESAGDFQARLAAQADSAPATGILLTPHLLSRAAQLFRREFDPVHGGFGSAPKFPRPSQPAFLLSHGVRQRDPELIQMVLETCARMAAGGICDQLGGGFCRYSVDAEWLVPHFEKMLYDNAQLATLYLDAYRVSHETRFAEVARDIFRYLLRDMTHPEGGFYSAEDADSEGKEGKFYAWTRRELADLLSKEEFEVAARYFGVTEAGNFIDHSDPDPLPNQNVLHIANPNLDSAQARLLASAKGKMFARRSQRARPHLDDKILGSWNGMMLGALARGYAVLEDRSYLEAAEKNLQFLKDHLWDASTQTLSHRWRDGERDEVQLLDSYAQVATGALDLYEATLDQSHLEFAIHLAAKMLERFFDSVHGGFWQAPASASDLIVRLKDDYDGAEPSGNSVAVLLLLRLSAITGQNHWWEAAEKTTRFMAERLEQLPQALPHLLIAVDFWIHAPGRIVLVPPAAQSVPTPLLHAAHSVFLPATVILGVAGPVDPFARSLPSQHQRATAYVCSGASCRPPVTSPEQLRATLQN